MFVRPVLVEKMHTLYRYEGHFISAISLTQLRPELRLNCGLRESFRIPDRAGRSVGMEPMTSRTFTPCSNELFNHPCGRRYPECVTNSNNKLVVIRDKKFPRRPLGFDFT